MPRAHWQHIPELESLRPWMRQVAITQAASGMNTTDAVRHHHPELKRGAAYKRAFICNHDPQYIKAVNSLESQRAFKEMRNFSKKVLGAANESISSLTSQRGRLEQDIEKLRAKGDDPAAVLRTEGELRLVNASLARMQPENRLAEKAEEPKMTGEDVERLLSEARESGDDAKAKE